jgi:hypothetical protein
VRHSCGASTKVLAQRCSNGDDYQRDAAAVDEARTVDGNGEKW